MLNLIVFFYFGTKLQIQFAFAHFYRGKGLYKRLFYLSICLFVFAFFGMFRKYFQKLPAKLQ